MSWTQAPVLDRSGRPDRWSSLPTEADVYGWFEGATRAGLPIMVHAGGLEILKIFNRVHNAVHPRDPRFRIEHAHDVPSGWFSLYAAAQVIASVQPPLLAAFDRGESGDPPPGDLFPCRLLLDAGVKIVLGTDSVTATPLTSPFEVMALAMARPGPDGRRLTLEQCLNAYTLDAAFAEFSEGDKGTLEAGKLADFILLDRDLFQSSAESLASVRVLMTVLDGRIVHEVGQEPSGASGPVGPPRGLLPKAWESPIVAAKRNPR
jgi:predicted amidohydrolase YtcJ